MRTTTTLSSIKDIWLNYVLTFKSWFSWETDRVTDQRFIPFVAGGKDPSHQMTENDINDDKLQLPDGIGIKWKELARVLGYRNAIIEAIEKEKGSSTKECCIDLLIRWIGREGSEATAGRLADALEKIERKNLADNLIRGKQERNGSFHCSLREWDRKTDCR